MLVYILCIGLAAVGSAESQPTALSELDPPYCAVRYRRLCQGKGRHVACQFPSPGPGESCVNYTMITFTKELKHFITHYINRRRQRLASGNERVRGGVHLPRPEVMMQVEWDRELALLAQRLADQCSFVHDDCRATVRFPYAGQTVGEVKWRRTSESDAQNLVRAVRRVLDAWWGERRRVTAKQLTQPFRLTNRGNVWGHFSQLAVWTLRAVGCGAVRHGNRYPKILLVCDFSHTNMLGQRTIVPGPLGTCPIHTARKQRSPYPMLCAPVRHQEADGEDLNPDHQHPEHDFHDDEESTEDIGEEYLDNAFFANDTTTSKPKEFTATNARRPFTRKRMRMNPWGETETPHEIEQNLENESEDNEIISRARDEYEKATNDDKKITQENVVPQEEHERSYTKKTHDRITVRQTTNRDDETVQESELDNEDDTDQDSGTYQIKRIRDRGKIQEKSNQEKNNQDIAKLIENDDVKNTDQVVERLMNKDKFKEKGRTQDSEDDQEKYLDKNTKSYKIKRIRDREKGVGKERIKETPERLRAPERDGPPGRERLQNEDNPERQLDNGRERPLGQERATTEEIPKRERPSARKGPPDRTSYESLNRKPVPERPVERERTVERERITGRVRPLERERVPGRELPPGREKQPEIPPERERIPNRDRLPERERVLERPVARERLVEQITDTALDILKGVESMTERYKVTTERERTRYMINLGDIQKKPKKVLDIKVRKGGNRQRQFHRMQENPIDKFTIEHVQDYKDMPVASTPMDRVHSNNVSPQKYRLNKFDEYEASSKHFLEQLKAATSTGEPRRTQFYEPVGVRHRWRPTKDRPERPGARALMTNVLLYTTTRAPAARKNSVTFASIVMDKEDVEQLFKDTGFNPGWKQYKKILS